MADDPETTGTPDEAVEQVADDAAPAGASESTPAEPEENLTPKERRQRRRARAVAKRGARRAATPEEREAERRRKAAQRRTYRERLKARRVERAGGGAIQQPVVEGPEKTGHQKVRLGVVVSDKADKTIVVRIDVARRHRRYQKTIRTSSKLHAHDERNEAHAGDTVRVVEARPLSRTKRWRLVEVVERAR